MKILITGANGFTGQQLRKYLLQKPAYRVFATSQKPDAFPHLGGSFAQADLTNARAVHDLLAQCRPDVVVNCAAATKVDDCERNPDMAYAINALAVAQLAAACRSQGAHLLHLSTDFVFDGTHGLSAETDLPNPINKYGISKLAGEQLALDLLPETAILRTVLVFGQVEAGARSNFVLWVRENLAAHKTIRVVNDQWRNPTYVADLVQGIEAAILHKAGGIYHLAGKDRTNIFDFAQLIARVYGLDPGLILPTDGSQLKETGERPKDGGLKIDKAIHQFGYSPHSLEEALRKMKQAEEA